MCTTLLGHTSTLPRLVVLGHGFEASFLDSAKSQMFHHAPCFMTEAMKYTKVAQILRLGRRGCRRRHLALPGRHDSPTRPIWRVERGPAAGLIHVPPGGAFGVPKISLTATVRNQAMPPCRFRGVYLQTPAFSVDGKR